MDRRQPRPHSTVAGWTASPSPSEPPTRTRVCRSRLSIVRRETPWRKLARRGVVFDRYFSSYLGGSLPNTLSLVAGDAYGHDQGSSADLASLWDSDIPTVFDRATQAGVSWKYYVGGLEQIHERKIANGSYARSTAATPSALYWAPILSMQRFWTDPALAQNVRPQADLFADAASGSLPAITYVLPQPTTHEPQVVAPDLRLLSIVNALETSPDWSTTAVVVTWDDWGGYYDHVAPPVASDGHQLGMRVPMLLLSPWTQGGTVSSQTLDHSSIPALATSLFGLGPDHAAHRRVERAVALDARDQPSDRVPHARAQVRGRGHDARSQRVWVVSIDNARDRWCPRLVGLQHAA